MHIKWNIIKWDTQKTKKNLESIKVTKKKIRLEVKCFWKTFGKNNKKVKWNAIIFNIKEISMKKS